MLGESASACARAGPLLEGAGAHVLAVGDNEMRLRRALDEQSSELREGLRTEGCAVKRELDVRPDQASDTGVGALERWLPFSGSQTEWPDIRR